MEIIQTKRFPNDKQHYLLPSKINTTSVKPNLGVKTPKTSIFHSDRASFQFPEQDSMCEYKKGPPTSVRTKDGIAFVKEREWCSSPYPQLNKRKTYKHEYWYALTPTALWLSILPELQAFKPKTRGCYTWSFLKIQYIHLIVRKQTWAKQNGVNKEEKR